VTPTDDVDVVCCGYFYFFGGTDVRVCVFLPGYNGQRTDGPRQRYVPEMFNYMRQARSGPRPGWMF
jgi:hypothetical protein